MPERSRRVLRLLAATTLLVVGPAFVVLLPSSPTPASSCGTLRQWAQARHQSAPTLEDLAAFDRAHRVALFNALKPEVQASIWQEHLRRFSERPELSAAQRALVFEGIGLTTPALYSREAGAVAAFHAFWSRAKESFTTPIEKHAWFDLGPAESKRHSTASTWEIVQSAFKLNAQDIPYCECSTRWQDCWTSSCVTGWCQWWVGCGPVMADPCDGQCAQ